MELIEITSFSDPYSPTPNPALISDEAREEFWAKQATRLDWAEPWHTTHRFDKPQKIGTDEAGNDILSGGPGDDRLDGGPGRDIEHQ